MDVAGLTPPGHDTSCKLQPFGTEKYMRDMHDIGGTSAFCIFQQLVIQ